MKDLTKLHDAMNLLKITKNNVIGVLRELFPLERNGDVSMEEFQIVQDLRDNETRFDDLNAVELEAVVNKLDFMEKVVG